MNRPDLLAQEGSRLFFARCFANFSSSSSSGSGMLSNVAAGFAFTAP